MKFICTQENLARGLGRVVPIAGRNRQLPILSHILLEVKEGVLHLTSTDLELGVHAIVLGKVEKEGTCAVSARKLMDYIQQLPASSPVYIEQKETTLVVKTKGFQAQFPTINAEEYPILPKPEGGIEADLSGGVFCRGLTQSLFAAARDETRPEIHSVYVNAVDDKITIAATDSFRLIEVKVPIEDKISEFVILLPLATAQEVVRLFNEQERVKIISSDSHILITSDGLELFSRLVDGKYPDYRQIIPDKFTTTGIVRRDEFIRALKTLTVFLPRDSRRVKVKVSPSNGSMVLNVGGGDSGEGCVELDFEGQGEDLEVMFNIQYLLEGSGSLIGDGIKIKFVGMTDATVFTLENNEDVIYVVMPIQV